MVPDELPKPTIRRPDLPKVVVPPIPLDAPDPAVTEDGAMSGGPPPAAAAVRVNVRVADDGREAVADEVRAPFNPRFLAAVIDVLMAAGIYYALVFVFPGFLEWAAWIAAGGYWVLRDSLAISGGRGIGKSVMNLRVVALDGSPLTGRWREAAIRNVPLLVPPFFLVEVIVLLTREEEAGRRNRLGDEWAKTKVIVVPVVVDESGT